MRSHQGWCRIGGDWADRAYREESEDANPIQPRSLAAALGLPLLTLLEYAKRLIAEELCNLAHFYYATGKREIALTLTAAADVLGSTPIATYTPFNGTSIVFELEPFRSRIGVISFERRMLKVPRALGFTGYALAGWQLQKPYSAFNHTWIRLRELAKTLGVRPEDLACTLRNATKILEDILRIHINETILAKVYIYSLRELLERIHGCAAATNTTLAGLIALNISLPEYNILMDITLNISRIINKLTSYKTPRITAISSDSLGTVLLYDPA